MEPGDSQDADWFDSIISALDVPSGTAILVAHRANLSDEDIAVLAAALKASADAALRTDLPRSEYSAQMLYALADAVGNPVWRALGLRAQANIESIGRREFQKSTGLYDEAAAIYRALGMQVQEAEASVGKVGALAVMGRYDEAFAVAEWAGRVLQENERWSPYVTLLLNVGIIHNRLRNDVAALAVFDQARAACERLGDSGTATLMMIENNRAIHLRNLGRYREALLAGDAAHALAERLGYRIEAARIEHNQAYVWTALGNYNRALQLFANARVTLLNDDRTRDVLMLDADVIECWLQLGRFDRVLETCRQTRPLFARSQAHLEIGNVIQYESFALYRLNRYDEALDALHEAERQFEVAQSAVNVAIARLGAASILYAQGNWAASLRLAEACLNVFRTQQAPVEYANACLVAARSAARLGLDAEVTKFVDQALDEGRDFPTLAYQAHFLRAEQLASHGRHAAALAQYDRAIAAVERLRGNVMVEFRSSFIADKQIVYEGATRTAIQIGDAAMALRYTEMAKSRALIDLLGAKLDVGIRPRSQADVELVNEINQLRGERDRLVRRQESARRMPYEESSTQSVADRAQRGEAQAILLIERHITDRWHDLLVHDAAYARDGTEWPSPPEPVQPLLNDDTALLEYYSIGDAWFAFVVSSHEVTVRPLPILTAELAGVRQKLALNFRAVNHAPQRASALGPNSLRILQHLHRALVAPVQDLLRPFTRLVIVPHGLLHGLPMHALHDGTAYLLEQHEISYLPAAGLLRYCLEPKKAAGSVMVFGCSNGGRLPGAPREAMMVAAHLGGQAIVEEQATLDQLRTALTSSRVVHLATHAEFNVENPLFSNLTMYDGALTALEIYGLRMQASLVTLSACQTGENAIGGGDELSGLTRAFLYAGASSLILSGWKVNDAFTTDLMDRVYQGLASGLDKGRALREAQLDILCQSPAETPYAHPQFWASFYLVGDWGAL
ncbi:MAG TPA: CHAT domain-containing protein [Anaerolineae bacterium]|jgi:CHAT domain-containing protein/tetratricopeptide (TPR) repeat protein